LSCNVAASSWFACRMAGRHALSRHFLASVYVLLSVRFLFPSFLIPFPMLLLSVHLLPHPLLSSPLPPISPPVSSPLLPSPLLSFQVLSSQLVSCHVVPFGATLSSSYSVTVSPIAAISILQATCAKRASPFSPPIVIRWLRHHRTPQLPSSAPLRMSWPRRRRSTAFARAAAIAASVYAAATDATERGPSLRVHAKQTAQLERASPKADVDLAPFADDPYMQQLHDYAAVDTQYKKGDLSYVVVRVVVLWAGLVVGVWW
jgi:hypothetical protein